MNALRTFFQTYLRWFYNRQFSLLPSIGVWFGLMLAICAWLMQTVPILSPLWVDEPELGYGICVELTPVVERAKIQQKHIHQLSTHQHSLAQHSSTHFHHTDLHQHTQHSNHDENTNIHHHSLFSQTIHQHSEHSHHHQHDCLVCSMMVSFALSSAKLPMVSIFTEMPLPDVIMVLSEILPSDADFLRPFLRAPPILSFLF